MSMNKAYIGKSKVHGKGVLARKDIKKGEKIFTVQGKKVKFLITSQKIADTISYNLYGVDKNTWIHPKGLGPYLNHSCNPNSMFTEKNKIVSLQNIKKGEEITSDYSFYEADIFWRFHCSCGEKNCRKTVQSIQFLPKKFFARYCNRSTPYYKEVFRKFNRENFKSYKDFKKTWVDFIKKDFRV